MAQTTLGTVVVLIVLAAIVNIILNFLLIKRLGVYGVITTQLVTYIVLVTYRWHDMKRYFTLKINKRVLIPIAVILLSALPFYYSPGVWFDIAFMLVGLAVIAWACDKELRDLLLSKFIKTHSSTK